MKITAQFDRLYTGESNSRTLYLERDEKYADKNICLGFVTPLGRLYITDPVEFTENSCEYLIPEGLLDGRGKLFVQLIATEGERYIAKSKLYEYPVFPSVDDLSLPEASATDLKSIAELFEMIRKKADSGHNHDDRYYTEEETDIHLSGKSDASHLHSGVYLTREEIEELIADVPPGSHHHDGRYYTEAETDSLLSGKSNTDHSHSYSSLSDKPTIDGKEISGDISTDGLMYKRLLTSADDMDELFEDGVYVYSTSSLPENAPFKNAAVVEVFGARSTTTQKIQRAYRYGDAGHSAFRPLYAGAWGEWTVAPTEYVTENGQSGGLYYKKWKSGAAEIWGKVTYTASSAVAAGGEYEFDIALPFACTDICAFIHANTRVYKVRKAYPLTLTGTKVTVYTKLESSEALSEGATIDYILNIRCNQA